MALTGPHQLVRIRASKPMQRAHALADLASELDERQRAMQCAHDARGSYMKALAASVEQIQAASQRGTFGEGAGWVERVTLEHAQQYLRAIESWDRGDMALTPAPWRALFAQARHALSERDVERHSMIVHLSYDLPLALARPAFPDGDRDAARTAYARMCDLLASESSRLRRLLRRQCGHERARRDRAWVDAMSLIDAKDGDALRTSFTELERHVLVEVAG